jgi:hypothetical protein
MATLSQLQRKQKSIVDVLVKQVVDKAPIKTGRLRKALKKANTVNTVLENTGGFSKNIPIQSFEFSINYAPDDAPYGKYWNDPTLAKNIKKGKTKNIPQSINFAEKAILTPEFQRGLDDLLDLIDESIADNVVRELE